MALGIIDHLLWLPVILCFQWNFVVDLDGFDNVSVNPETKITPKKVMKKKTNAHGVKEEKSKVKSKDEGVKVVKVANDAQVVSSLFVISTDLVSLTLRRATISCHSCSYSSFTP